MTRLLAWIRRHDLDWARIAAAGDVGLLRPLHRDPRP